MLCINILLCTNIVRCTCVLLVQISHIWRVQRHTRTPSCTAPSARRPPTRSYSHPSTSRRCVRSRSPRTRSSTSGRQFRSCSSRTLRRPLLLPRRLEMLPQQRDRALALCRLSTCSDPPPMRNQLLPLARIRRRAPNHDNSDSRLCALISISRCLARSVPL